MTVSLDNALWLASFTTEVAVAALLFYRRVWRILPFFCVYIVWTLASDVGVYSLYRLFPDSTLTIYLVQTIVDSVLQFGVLVELAWSVLRPIRPSLPRSALFVIAALILAAGSLVWLFSTVPAMKAQSAEMQALMHLQQTVNIFRVLVFVVLAGCSQLLSIGWRDRELQVATGLGIYSLVGLAVAMLHAYPSMNSRYNRLVQILVASYVCSLLYWVVSFAQKEAARQEFSPRMQSILLTVAGAARANRVALADSSGAGAGKRPKP